MVKVYVRLHRDLVLSWVHSYILWIDMCMNEKKKKGSIANGDEFISII